MIPTYRRREAVCRALRHVRAGRLQPTEIVVVDDGSDDGTADAVRAAFPDVALVVLPVNRGVSAARNVGIKRARCEWIALLDSDDWWLPEHLEALVEHLVAHPETRVAQTRERWYRKGRRVNPKQHHIPPSGDIFEASLRLCLVSSSAVVFRRELFDAVGGYDERLPACEDYDLWLRMARVAPFGLVARETIEKEGGRPDQLSRRHWGMDRFRVFAIARLLRNGTLSGAHAAAARGIAIVKLEVLRAGAAKRGKTADVAAYDAWAAVVRDPRPEDGFESSRRQAIVRALDDSARRLDGSFPTPEPVTSSESVSYADPILDALLPPRAPNRDR